MWAVLGTSSLAGPAVSIFEYQLKADTLRYQRISWLGGKHIAPPASVPEAKIKAGKEGFSLLVANIHCSRRLFQIVFLFPLNESLEDGRPVNAVLGWLKEDPPAVAFKESGEIVSAPRDGYLSPRLKMLANLAVC